MHSSRCAVRDLALFYKLFLIDAQNRKAVQLCPFVKSGVMHKAFQPLVRADRLGIDYSKLGAYDTASVLEAHLAKQHPYWEKAIQRMIDTQTVEGLAEAVSNADKIGLSKKRPDLIQAARDLLNKPR